MRTSAIVTGRMILVMGVVLLAIGAWAEGGTADLERIAVLSSDAQPFARVLNSNEMARMLGQAGCAKCSARSNNHPYGCSDWDTCFEAEWDCKRSEGTQYCTEQHFYTFSKCYPDPEHPWRSCDNGYWKDCMWKMRNVVKPEDPECAAEGACWHEVDDPPCGSLMYGTGHVCAD